MKTTLGFWESFRDVVYEKYAPDSHAFDGSQICVVLRRKGKQIYPVKLRHSMKHTLAGACAALFIFSGHTALLALFNRPVSVLDQARQITASVVAFKVRLMQH